MSGINQESQFTKVGSTVPISSIMDSPGEDDAGWAESVFVLDENNNTGRPIVELNYSLLKHLADIKLYALRVYVIIPPDRDELFDQIKTRIHASGM